MAKMKDVGDSEKVAALAAYNAVVADAELFEIQLIDLNFQVKQEVFEILESERPSGRRSRKVLDHEFIFTAYNPDTSGLYGQIRWIVEVRAGSKKVFSVKANYFIAYVNVPRVEEEHAIAFLKKVGKFSVYPYFRSTVSMLASEARVDLPILPILK